MDVLDQSFSIGETLPLFFGSFEGNIENALGSLNRVIIDMADGYLLVTAISAGSVLGVIADRTANLGTLAYEMTLFATRAGGALSPRLIAELKNAVQQ